MFESLWRESWMVSTVLKQCTHQSNRMDYYGMVKCEGFMCVRAGKRWACPVLTIETADGLSGDRKRTGWCSGAVLLPGTLLRHACARSGPSSNACLRFNCRSHQTQASPVICLLYFCFLSTMAQASGPRLPQRDFLVKREIKNTEEETENVLLCS